MEKGKIYDLIVTHIFRKDLRTLNATELYSVAEHLADEIYYADRCKVCSSCASQGYNFCSNCGKNIKEYQNG